MIRKLKSMKNHRGFMKYLKNTSWLFGEKILRMVVGVFVGIWIVLDVQFQHVAGSKVYLGGS